MNNILNPLVDSAVQCWGCPVFDRLFVIISNAAAAVYDQFAVFCAIIFCVLFAFFVINAVWKNLKGDKDGKITDPLYQKSLKPVIINSLVSLAFLSMGVYLPRFVSSITFEPVANITLIYTQSMLQTDSETVNERVTYQPMEISDDGFFRPELRDSIIMLMKTTITQFQSYIKLGIAIMDKAFSLSALLGVGALIKHIVLFFIGLYLAYAFFKLFWRFCCYFADIIVAMTFFAFLFPLSLILVAFKGADAPSWISNLGKGVGTDQFKKLINSIIALAAAVLTYTVIMVIIAKFFSAPGQSATDIMTLITSGEIFAGDLSEDNLAAITLGGCIILVYVLNFLYAQIPTVTKMVLDSFGVSQENQLSEELADGTMKLTSNIIKSVKKAGKIIISGGNTDNKSDDKSGDKPGAKSDDKSDDKSGDKSGDKKGGTTK